MEMGRGHTDAMRDALAKWSRDEAKRRMIAARDGENLEDTPRLHKAGAIDTKDGALNIHFENPGKYGRNIIAIPDINQRDDNTLHVSGKARLVEIDLP